MVNKKIENVKVTISIADLITEHSDCIINWTTPDLSSGDEFFQLLHKESGSIVYKECLGMLVKYGIPNKEGEKMLPLGQAIVTSCGILDIRRTIHCVTPNYRIKEQNQNKMASLIASLNYAFMLVKELQEKERIKSIIIPIIPEKIFGEITTSQISQLFEIILNTCEDCNIREIKLLGLTQLDIDLYEKAFTQKYNTIWDKIYTKLFC